MVDFRFRSVSDIRQHPEESDENREINDGRKLGISIYLDVSIYIFHEQKRSHIPSGLFTHLFFFLSVPSVADESENYN